MELKTILNRVYQLPGFVYGKIRLVRAEEEGERDRLEVEVRPRANGRALCSGCGQPAPGYDRLQPRRFQFVPVLGLQTFFVYAMRRVHCPRCGKVKVERVPWAQGKQQATEALDWFLASWARRLSWKETATVFGVSWDRVYRAVGMAVAWGRERVSLEGVTTIGVDEIAWQRGHRYLTLVYQLDAGCRRLLWVGQERKITTLESFFTWFGKERSARLQVVCSDMWKAYLRVVKEQASQARHVLDRFHIVQKLGKAIDKVRGGGGEAAEGARQGAGAEEFALAAAEAAGAADREAGAEAGGAAQAEPAHGAGLPAEGRLPVAVGLPLADAGQQVPQALVPARDALADPADAEGGEDAAQAPAAGAELVPHRAGLLLGRGGGHEQQSQDRPQESVRIPILQVLRTRAISYTCGLAATQPCPQVLLKNRFFQLFCVFCP